MAVLCGRDYVIPEDIKEVYYDVFAHRVRMDTMAKAEGMTVIEVLVQVFEHEKI